jgi:hypothetical protein
MALVIGAWIQFARPRLAASRIEWPITAAAGVLCLGIGVFLAATDLPSRFRTLNETFLGLALLLPYLQLRRPLPGRVALWIALVLLAVMVAGGERVSVITDLAETLGLLFLAPIGLDLVDRGILDSSAVTSVRARWSWYGFLFVAPLVFSVLEYGVKVRGGALGELVRYTVRPTEAFICMFLIGLYFAVVLGRTGAVTEATPAAGAISAPETAPAAGASSGPEATSGPETTSGPGVGGIPEPDLEISLERQPRELTIPPAERYADASQTHQGESR